jgi:hypothetical protein
MAKPDNTQLNFSKTTDANGWTVYNFGNFKMYQKAGFGASVPANGFASTSSVSLPVGTTTSTVNPMFACKGSAAGQVIATLTNADSTHVQVDYHSTAGAALNPEGVITYLDV